MSYHKLSKDQNGPKKIINALLYLPYPRHFWAFSNRTCPMFILFFKGKTNQKPALKQYKSQSKMENIEGGYKLFGLAQNFAINKKSTIVVQSF